MITNMQTFWATIVSGTREVQQLIVSLRIYLVFVEVTELAYIGTCMPFKHSFFVNWNYNQFLNPQLYLFLLILVTITLIKLMTKSLFVDYNKLSSYRYLLFCESCGITPVLALHGLAIVVAVILYNSCDKSMTLISNQQLAQKKNINMIMPKQFSDSEI